MLTNGAIKESSSDSLYDTAELYRDYAARVTRWATRLTHSASDADDIVQEVFLIVHRRNPSRNDVHSPGSWLLKVTLNVVRHLWRARGRSARREESWDQEQCQQTTTTPLDQLEAKRAVERLKSAVDSLEPRYRTVYWLCEIKRLPPVKVAAMTGLQPQTLRVRRFRARKQIALRLSAADNDVRAA
jgi:RNA polymerase sigma-70 factor (ECF subfamily)